MVDHEGGHILTFRDGKITRWEPYRGRADAIRAAGLDQE
jgi:hypothetical protein